MQYQCDTGREFAFWWPGTYLGGGAIVPCPSPLWVDRIAKLHRKVSKIEAFPPPLQVGHKVWSHKGYLLWVSSRLHAWNQTEFEWRPLFFSTPDFGAKNRTKFEWRTFFFFCSSFDFGRKIGLISGGTISDSDLCSSHIFRSFWPPFSKSCVRYCWWPMLSDFDQRNLRRGYDGKCKNCPRVWFEGSGGVPD